MIVKVFLFAAATHGQQWYHASQPINLSCLKSSDADTIAIMHETIFDSTKPLAPCTEGWDNVVAQTGNDIQAYFQCQKSNAQAPFTPQNCDVGCQKKPYRVVDTDANVAASPDQFDKSCTAIATRLTANITTSMLQSSSSFTDLSMFAKSPGKFYRVNQYPAGSDCNTQAPTEVHLYPVYGVCTSINSYYIQTRFANETLQQLICSDSGCSNCVAKTVPTASLNCQDYKGARYRSLFMHDYISPKIGFFVAKVVDGPPAPPIAGGSMIAFIIGGVVFIAIVFGGILLYSRQQKRKLHDDYFGDEYRSVISSHLEKKKNRSNISSSSSIMSEKTLTSSPIQEPKQMAPSKPQQRLGEPANGLFRSNSTKEFVNGPKPALMRSNSDRDPQMNRRGPPPTNMQDGGRFNNTPAQNRVPAGPLNAPPANRVQGGPLYAPAPNRLQNGLGQRQQPGPEAYPSRKTRPGMGPGMNQPSPQGRNMPNANQRGNGNPGAALNRSGSAGKDPRLANR